MKENLSYVHAMVSRKPRMAHSRPVLSTAHALGFGVYREADELTGTGLIQIFEQSSLWEDVGYSIVSGELKAGEEVVLSRTSSSSPDFLEKHSSIDDLIQFISFETEQQQTDWVVEAICKNLKIDELRCDDIVVINPDPFTTRKTVGPIRERLYEFGIDTHLTGVDTSPDVFFKSDSDSIVFTGIYRAKGNEAGMIYIINAQDCYSSFGNLATVRNRLFTAITRSKAWVRVLGVGDGMRKLQAEFNAVKANNFNLRFRYPTEDQRNHMKIVNRDMTDEEKTRVKQGQQDFKQLLSDLETGKMFLQDLGEEDVKRLFALIREDMDKNAGS